jgi:purine-binding chemotaxis protein CheW
MNALDAPTATAGAVALRSEPRQIVTFRVDDRHFGVEVQAVREIKSWMETTPLPHAPVHVRGVLNLRGVILAVYDLRARLALGVTQATPSHVIVVVTIADRLVGLLVDSVSDILTVEESDIRPVPELETDKDGVIIGLVLREEHLVALLDLRAVLSDHPAAQTQAA